MTGAIPIRVKIPYESWQPLARRAQVAGFESPTAYVQDMVTRFVDTLTVRDRVLFMHSCGATNKEIAEETGLTIAAIRTRLSAVGLTSNRGR